MKQRTIMILTTILTAFMLVVVGGIVRNVTAGNADVSNSAPSNQEPAYQEPAAASDQIMVGVSADAATAIALQALPDGTLTKAPELVNYQGVVAYEILLDRASLYIDANSGEVLYNSAENSAAMGEYEEDDDGEYEEGEEYEDDDDDDDDHEEYEEGEEHDDDDDEYEESDD